MFSLFSPNIFSLESPYKKIILPIISKITSSENIILYYSHLSSFFENSFFDIDSDKKPSLFFSPGKIAKKYELINSILSNIFLNDSQKTELLKIISILQKGMNGIRRFIYLYRFKKSRIYNTTDLCGDPIPMNSRLSITIFQNNTRYCFLLREVMKIIISALSNSVHFFSEPVPCKNPYTNLPFNKSALYNIYFAIRFSSSLKIPELFHRYFLLDFHLYDFLINSDEEIREEYLKSYIKNIGNHLHGEIRMIVHDIFIENKIFCIHIHRSFPEDRLLAIMLPYLELYYKVKYSLKRSYISHLSVVLQYSLLRFVKYNRFFGRRISKREKINGVWKRVIDFNDKHIDFQLLNDCDYEECHLSCFSDIVSRMVREIKELKKLKYIKLPVIIMKDEDEDADNDVDEELDTDDDSDDNPDPGYNQYGEYILEEESDEQEESDDDDDDVHEEIFEENYSFTNNYDNTDEETPIFFNISIEESIPEYEDNNTNNIEEEFNRLVDAMSRENTPKLNDYDNVD